MPINLKTQLALEAENTKPCACGAPRYLHLDVCEPCLYSSVCEDLGEATILVRP